MHKGTAASHDGVYTAPFSTSQAVNALHLWHTCSMTLSTVSSNSITWVCPSTGEDILHVYVQQSCGNDHTK